MALTVAVKTPDKAVVQTQPYGTSLVLQVAQITYDNSYPSLGYPISASSFNMLGVLGAWQIGYSALATPTLGWFDATNSTWRVLGSVSTNTAALQLTATQSVFAEVAVGSAAINNVSPTICVIGF